MRNPPKKKQKIETVAGCMGACRFPVWAAKVAENTETDKSRRKVKSSSSGEGKIMR